MILTKTAILAGSLLASRVYGALADNITLSTLARDLARVESIREIKDVQRTFSQLAQFGRWSDMASLFSRYGTLVWGNEAATGRATIESWLRDDAAGMDGIQPGSLDTMVAETPLITIAADGQSAQGRWNGLRFMGDGKGGTRIQGGIYENKYILTEEGWKLSLLDYYDLYAGPYEEGWRNVGDGVPIVPYHYTPDEAGFPAVKYDGEAFSVNTTLEELGQRIDWLNDEDEVRNLQHAYGYYVDRRMWTDVLDLFASDARVHIDGIGSFSSISGIREAMERMGPEGLTRGILNDHPIFSTIVNISPGGKEATARGIEIGMVGDVSARTASWEFSVFRNTFVKDDNGIWKFSELNITPLIAADYFQGWGNGGTLKRDSNSSSSEPPSFLNITPRHSRSLSKTTTPSNSTSSSTSLADLARRLARSSAYDGTENISSAYGYYLDDLACPLLGAIHSPRGNKLSPFTGWYATPERITAACAANYGNGTVRPPLRPSVAFHWRPQPVILASPDGRSATLRARLLQPHTSGRAGAGAFNGAMYHDQAVLDGRTGAWKLWSVTIDEFYWMSRDWAGGWASPGSISSGNSTNGTSAAGNVTSALAKRYPPDLTIPEVGDREAGFKGGMGREVAWPEIQRMWFQYRNPVSGRVPEHYWPGCVPCRARPEWALEANGYEEPPTGPAVLNLTTGGGARRRAKRGNGWRGL